MTTQEEYIERLLSKVVEEPTSGCWLWSACLNAQGYGLLSYQRKSNLAHRVSYALLVGDIPSGKIVRHRCDVPACVNPDHLEIGTRADNSRDMVLRGRSAAGERRPQSYLTEEDVLSIRREKSQGARTKDLAEKFGTTQPNICSIVSRRTWKHV